MHIINKNRFALIDLRKDIRQSSKLNELLFDNHKGLFGVFDHIRNKFNFNQPGRFTMQAAFEFFKILIQENRLPFTLELVKQSFVLSQMTIINEDKNMEKYYYLVFVEFQEMICRLAHYAFKDIETIQYKVYYFLKILWDYMYSQ